MTLFDAVLHLGHFMLVLIKTFFSNYNHQFFGEINEAKFCVFTTFNLKYFHLIIMVLMLFLN